MQQRDAPGENHSLQAKKVDLKRPYETYFGFTLRGIFEIVSATMSPRSKSGREMRMLFTCDHATYACHGCPSAMAIGYAIE